MRFDDPIALIRCALFVAFWLIVCGLLFVAWRGFRARRYARAFLPCLGVLGMLWLGLYTGATPGSGAFTHSLETRELFGRMFYVSSPRLRYCDPGMIEVDYIEVCDISDSLAKWASSPPPEFTANYPEAWPQRYYKRVKWRPTPVERELDEKYLGKISISPPDDRPPGSDDMEKAEKLLHQLARKPGSYFAYYYDENDSDMCPVTFYLLSPFKRVLIKAHVY